MKPVFVVLAAAILGGTVQSLAAAEGIDAPVREIEDTIGASISNAELQDTLSID